MKTLNNTPIIDNSDRIIYYDSDGRILEEVRILNNTHQHEYFALKNNANKTLKFNNQNYRITDFRIEYDQKPYGTIRITHIKLAPFIDGQHY
jgi:hypothetical protein